MLVQYPLLGTTSRVLHVGQVTHHVPDHAAIARLRDDLDFATDDADWYSCLLFSDGRGSLRGHTDTTPAPPQDVLDKMVDLATRLNRELHLDGHWVLFWADGSLGSLWRDDSGDMQFEVTFEEPWPRVKAWAWDEFARRCATAWDEWSRRMRECVEVKPSQKYNRALGETPPSQRPH